MPSSCGAPSSAFFCGSRGAKRRGLFGFSRSCILTIVREIALRQQVDGAEKHFSRTSGTNRRMSIYRCDSDRVASRQIMTSTCKDVLTTVIVPRGRTGGYRSHPPLRKASLSPFLNSNSVFHPSFDKPRTLALIPS